MDTMTIGGRFCGPPGTGNGGYVCGRLAALFGDAAEVTLRRPVPLDRALRIECREDGSIALRDGETVIAEARPGDPVLDPPSAPHFAEAATAATSYIGFTEHKFPGCFVCGPARRPGDGLRIFAGPLAPDGMVAAPWVPDASLADATGRVRPEFIWAALDCPGGFAVVGAKLRPILLGRLAARSMGSVNAHERCVVLGWKIAAEGRKLTAGSAVFGADGGLRGVARAIWLTIEP